MNIYSVDKQCSGQGNPDADATADESNPYMSEIKISRIYRIYSITCIRQRVRLTATSRKCEIGDSSVLVISSLNRQISHACSELHRPFNTSVISLAGSNISAENTRR